MYIGGCVSISYSLLIKISTSSFRICCTNHWGGGLLCLNSSQVNIEKSLFLECYSQYSGGSILLWYIDDALIDNCSFLHSYGDDFGGAIGFVYLVNFTVMNSQFYNCSSPNTASFLRVNKGAGGAIDLEYPYVSRVCNCSFIKCLAEIYGMLVMFVYAFVLGGALSFIHNNKYLSESNVDYIINCTFLNNQASSGGIDVFVTPAIPLTSSQVYGCCTDRSGTFYIEGMDTRALLSTSCSSPPSPSLNSCPPPFFLSVDQLSCVRNCSEGAIGSFGKCYEWCDYSHTHIGTRIYGSCESSCALLFYECDCSRFSNTENCLTGKGGIDLSLCMWLEGNKDMEENGECVEEV
jgi:hypothetical protein